MIKDTPINQSEGSGMQKESLRTVRHASTSLGIKAVVACSIKGKEEFTHEVKLWNANSREDYADKCIKAMNGNLPPAKAEKARKHIDAWLRREEKRLKKIEEDKAHSATISDNGKPKRMTELEREEAFNLLQNPALLFMVGKVLRQLGLAGETINALLLYLTLTSRLLQKIISAVVKAESGAGKSFLDGLVRKFFPPEAYKFMSSMSKQALVYSNEDYRHRMIIIAEATGTESAVYNIRTLLSENKLVFETVEKNPITNKLETRTIEKEGPTGLITTTTLSRLHPENETRLISLSLDESEQQTHNVKRSIALRYEEVDKEEPNLDVWINAQQLLKPVKVRIPYAKLLADRTPNEPLRMRRDFGKLMSFIEASATLHQHRRNEIAEGIIEANLADYFFAKTLLEDVFFASLYGIHPNTRTLMDAIKELYQQNKNQNEQFRGVDTRVTTEQLMTRLDWPKSKITRWAKPLWDYGWIQSEGQGKPNYYRPGKEIGEDHPQLPSVEELAEHFPDLAKDFMAVHPITGESVRLESETDSYADNGVYTEVRPWTS